jgi:hypothetical protein
VVENVGYYGFRPTPTQHRDSRSRSANLQSAGPRENRVCLVL